MSTEDRIAQDMRGTRAEVLLRSVLHRMERTVLLQGVTPETSIDGVMAKMTGDSIDLIAPLVEAVLILEEIIYASDGCIGHRDCNHSMEPWKRARALLGAKWKAYEDRTDWPAINSLSAARVTNHKPPFVMRCDPSALEGALASLVAGGYRLVSAFPTESTFDPPINDSRGVQAGISTVREITVIAEDRVTSQRD